MKNYDITALGELLIDFTYYGMSEAGGALFEQNPGGAVANVLAACAGFGLRTAFIGKVGRDMHGEFLRDTLRARDIDTSGLMFDEDAFTTLAFVKLDGHERSFSFARKPGADTRISAAELNREILESTSIFHFGSLSLTHEPAKSATLEALRLAKSAGALISYDPNYRAPLWPGEEKAVIEMRGVLGMVDVVKISGEEAVLLTGESDPEKAAGILLSKGAKCAVVTLGEDGAVAAVPEGAVREPAAPCRPADTTGAGDTFWGAFLYRILKSGKPVERHSLDEIRDYTIFANAAASVCVESRGGIPSMPSLEDVFKRLPN